MHPKVLSAEAWKLVDAMSRAGILEGWILAGGTGLAIQLGHRYSEDLDFFRAEDFAIEPLLVRLADIASLAIQDRSESTLHLTLDALRLTFLRAQAPLLFDPIDYRGLEIADPRDIAVMKLVAIGGRGSRKDFVDLFFYLQSGGSLEDAFALLRRRFENIDYNEYHLLKSLAYFEDAEAEPMPQMIRGKEWQEIKAAIQAEVRRLS